MAKATTTSKTTTKAKTATKAAAASKTTTARKVAPKKATAKTAAKSPVKVAAKKAAPEAAVNPAPLAAPSASAEALKVEPVVVQSSEPVVGLAEMRKEQLLDEVAKRTGAKRKDVKPVVEAVLEIMGEAIGEGQELNLKPLGKVKIARTKLVANGRVINLRLRQSDMVIKELEGAKEASEFNAGDIQDAAE